MTLRLQTLLSATAALALVTVLSTSASAQGFQSSSFSQKWSSSSGSSFGTRADGTTFRNGFSNSNSQLNATSTRGSFGPFGGRSNTTTLNASQSQNTGFSQVSGPGGIRQSAFNNQAGSLNLTNTRRRAGMFGNSTDTRSLNANFQSGNAVSQGIGPGGVFRNQVRSNSGNVSVGRTINANSVFGPSISAGATRNVGFSNQQTSSQGFGSGGLFNSNTNSSNLTIGGSNFFNVRP